VQTQKPSEGAAEKSPEASAEEQAALNEWLLAKTREALGKLDAAAVKAGLPLWAKAEEYLHSAIEALPEEDRVVKPAPKEKPVCRLRRASVSLLCQGAGWDRVPRRAVSLGRSLKPIRYTWSYSACKIRHCVPIWQPPDRILISLMAEEGSGCVGRDEGFATFMPGCCLALVPEAGLVSQMLLQNGFAGGDAGVGDCCPTNRGWGLLSTARCCLVGDAAGTRGLAWGLFVGCGSKGSTRE
jgi:hypothetical protein